jgi:MFS family permease
VSLGGGRGERGERGERGDAPTTCPLLPPILILRFAARFARDSARSLRYLGAGVSAADALSDAYMINAFYEMGEAGTANGLLAMVVANLAFQAIGVYVQTHNLKKDKWRTVLFEMLSVVTFAKPGVDAYRVASGAEQFPGAAMTPLVEMLCDKTGELVFEAIPG